MKRFLRTIINIEYDIVFSPGLFSLSNASHKKMIPINSVLNYPKKNGVIDQKKYCVYIDQAFPSHPDLVRLGYECPNTSAFINSFNEFFNYIEDKYDLEVIIARHPKSTIEDKMYDGRKTFVYKTEELIDNAAFVLGHISLVQNYAILNYIPIILFYNNEMKNFPNNFFQTMKKLQTILDCPLININELPQEIDILPNKKKYDNYISEYIIGDKNRQNPEIIIETLKKELQKI